MWVRMEGAAVNRKVQRIGNAYRTRPRRAGHSLIYRLVSPKCPSRAFSPLSSPPYPVPLAQHAAWGWYTASQPFLDSLYSHLLSLQPVPRYVRPRRDCLSLDRPLIPNLISAPIPARTTHLLHSYLHCWTASVVRDVIAFPRTRFPISCHVPVRSSRASSMALLLVPIPLEALVAKYAYRQRSLERDLAP